MCDEISRRNVMATGVAIALAAPFSTLTAASGSQAADWPEFAPWLSGVLQEAADYRLLDAADLSTEKEAEIDERIIRRGDELKRLAVAMLARPVTTPRQAAMLVAIALDCEPLRDPRTPFSMRFDAPEDEYIGGIVRPKLLTYAVQHIVDSGVLPEVPFGLPRVKV